MLPLKRIPTRETDVCYICYVTNWLFTDKSICNKSMCNRGVQKNRQEMDWAEKLRVVGSSPVGGKTRKVF